jgi:hypothetical protein
MRVGIFHLNISFNRCLNTDADIFSAKNIFFVHFMQKTGMAKIFYKQLSSKNQTINFPPTYILINFLSHRFVFSKNAKFLGDYAHKHNVAYFAEWS